MKKLVLLFCLVAFGMNAQTPTNTTQTINSKLKLTNVPVGTANDSILVRGSDKIVKKLPKADLFATIPTPTLQQVTTSGSTTNNLATFNGGVTVKSPLTLTGSSTLTLNAESASEFKLRNSSNVPIFGAGGNSIFFTDSGGFSSSIKSLSKTAHQDYLLPNQSGTLALSEYTVGDFINDNATTIAPSQNAVFDALAMKANDGSVVHKDGYEVITGNKRFAGMTMADGGLFVKQNDNSAYSVIDAQSGKIKFLNNSGVNFLGEFADTGVKFGSINKLGKIDVSGLTADRNYVLPNKSGTIALSDETVSLTGNQNISGTKTFTGSIYSNNQINSPNGYKFHDFANEVDMEFKEYDGGFSFMYGGVSALSFSSNEGFGINNHAGQSFYLDTSSATTNKIQKFINSSGSIPVIRDTAPASSTATGVKGEIYVDANYVYYCYAPNSWRRVAGTTF
ncbi:hypothetical protein V3468_02900 [Flavobacterium oreochromis]|uniref:hypothetical protein n=1 Tax=Flavobacterium oreochromis TaxID=2906078 RepID=UPI00385C8DF3